MTLARIEALLKERMGLDAASIGAAAIERAARERLAACRLESIDLYWRHLSGSEVELQELIEAVVVPETWFFRDREAFTALARLAQGWLPAHPEGTFRVLSLPCSTGEEPYTMAMALLDAGFPAERLAIDAVDISTRAIAFAGRGIYGKNSFRAKDLSFRERYFEPQGQAWKIGAGARRLVHFRHGNMLGVGWLPGAHQYDAIFCRNVLIYFDRPTQERAVEVLSRLLLPGGYLFVGPSESALLMDRGFASANKPLAFAFFKADPAARAARPRQAPPPARQARPRAVAAPPKPARKKPHEASAARPSAPAAAPAGEHALEEARQLADRGELTEAIQCCERHLREYPASAEGFYLLGVLHDATGLPRKAAEQYRKALYLDPAHHEALVHLATVLEAEGDTQGARRLFERAKRAGAGS